MEFETRALHAGQEPEAITGSVNVPIFQTSTYAQDGVNELRGGHDYARSINPTRTALEVCLASLEEATFAGEVSTAAEAVALARQLVGRGG